MSTAAATSKLSSDGANESCYVGQCPGIRKCHRTSHDLKPRMGTYVMMGEESVNVDLSDPSWPTIPSFAFLV